MAYCADANAISCTANAYGILAYINYSPDKMNNFSFRPEIYDDPNGWRTGTGVPTRYYAATLGWQHWYSPQVEIRPEISFWHSEAGAGYTGTFNGAFNGGTKADMFMFAMDAIVHF